MGIGSPQPGTRMQDTAHARGVALRRMPVPPKPKRVAQGGLPAQDGSHFWDTFDSQPHKSTVAFYPIPVHGIRNDHRFSGSGNRAG
jgi:hypothetical protein